MAQTDRLTLPFDFSRALTEARFSDSLVAGVCSAAERGVPLLALGQTVFWDELLKSMLAAAAREHAPGLRLVAGVHDTDYFSKLPDPGTDHNGFTLQPRDDDRTSQMWAAVAETSAVFGCEYPVLRSDLRAAGVPLHQLARTDPRGPREFYREATVAWGWRGVANHSAGRTVACDIAAAAVAPTVQELIDWAVARSREVVLDDEAHAAAERLRQIVGGLIDRCRSQTGERTLTDLYLCLLGGFYALLLGEIPENVQITASTVIFRFGPETINRPRFDMLDIFLDPRTREIACSAYDQVMGHSGIYRLEQFGEGALPFDIVICGRGRGTLRVLGDRAIVDLPEGVIETRATRDITDRDALLDALGAEFGCRLRLVGKAVVLPTMLSREFSMVLLERASVYVPQTHRFLRLLRRAGIEFPLNSIVRLHLETWDALAAAEVELRLPPHLARFFGQTEVTAAQFAENWRAATARARVALERLGAARAPTEILALLPAAGEDVRELEREFTVVAEERRRSGERIQALRARSQALWREIKHRLRTADARHEPPPAEDLRALRTARDEVIARIIEHEHDAEHVRLQRRYQELKLEIERAKLRVLSDAHRTLGLELSNYRPPWWWFLAVDPSGGWLRRVAETATLRFERFGLMI